MASSLGVNFVIGATLGASVASAFASVQNKLKAAQQSFKAANRKSKQLADVVASRERRDFAERQAALQMRSTGRVDDSLRQELKKLNDEYVKAAKKAGVYGQSLEMLRHSQRGMAAEAARSQRTINALQTVQRGRDIRSAESGRRKTAIGNFMADVGAMGALGAPIKIGMEFDAAMSKVAALSGATGESFDALRAQARKLGAETVWSAKEAADGMSFLAMAGFKTHEIMAAMPGMLSLASAGGMDLASTADIASNILTGFKKDASEMTDVGNILAKTFTKSNTSIASLGESFKYCAPVAANAGQSFESVAAMIGKLGDAGIQGSMAGTGLNAIIGRMAAPPKEAAAALAKLGVKVAEASGKMRPMEDVFADIQKSMGKYSEKQQIALAKALYGAEHFAKGFVLQIASANGSLYELRDSLHDVDGYSDNVAKIQNDNLAGDFKQFGSAMSEVAITITDVVTPPLRQLMGHITPIVQATGKWINANPRLAQGLMLVAGGFFALKTAGLALTLFDSYRKSFVGGLVSMRGQAMRPVAAVENRISRLRQELTRPLPGGSFTGSVRQGITSLKVRVDSLRASLGRARAGMANFGAASIMAAGKATIAGARAAASGVVAATGRAGWNMLRLGIKGVGMAFKTAFSPISLLMMALSFGADYVIEHWDKIAPYFQSLWENVKSIFSSVMGWLQPIFDAIGKLIDPFMEKLKVVGQTIGGMFEKLGRAWDWITGNDTEKEKQAQKAALADERKRQQEDIFAQMPEELREQARKDMDAQNAREAKSVWASESPGVATSQAAAVAPANRAAVVPPKEAAMETPVPVQKQTTPKAKPQDPMAIYQAKMNATSDDYGDDSEEPARPKRKNSAPRKAAASPAAQAAPETQVVQPQVQVQLNITQNGIPDAQFAQGVMSAIRARQSELESIISGIVNEQARLAYG